MLFIFIFIVQCLRAQDDLENLLNGQMEEETNYTEATFKSTRIMNGHSIERTKAGQLDFRISHRFGTVNSGIYEYFGLDQSNVHFGLEYGITNWLMTGFGRGTYQKTYDGFFKLSILRQSTGKKNMPISLSWVSSMAINTLKWENTERTNYFSSRLSYVHQLLVARKFNERFSLELNPTYVHRNLVKTALDMNDLWSLGAGTRFKLSKRISINAEYYAVLKAPGSQESTPSYNPLSIGFDIETGGHVFQLFFTNSLAMIEKGFIGETTGQWKHGDIHFGFNISRTFALINKK